MGVDILYNNAVGRTVLKVLEKTKAYSIAAAYLNSPYSKFLIKRFIRKNNIDMSCYEGEYDSFGRFFRREKNLVFENLNESCLISPCDSSLSVYRITDDLVMPIKGSHYTVCDLIPENEGEFKDGLCFVYRLQASDYHHFIAFDDANIVKHGYIPGLLHSVQPVALKTYPVFRLNRRWWSILNTSNFGTAAMIEIGAMSVGGVTFRTDDGNIKRFCDIGNFELAGSTIVVLINGTTSKNISLDKRIIDCIDSGNEVIVKIGEVIGQINRTN